MVKKYSKLSKKNSKKSKILSKTISPNTKQLPDHHFKKVKVKRGMSGLGLFADEPIKKGEVIIEYVGNILNEKEADAMNWSHYIFEISKNKNIDGSPRWNIARYCNHACEGAENAESDVKKGRVFISAIKNIKQGEEIVYDYGKEFFDEHIKKIGCKCSAKVHGGGKV